MTREPSLPELRRRRSAKWRQYPADVIPAWIAEMDVDLAEPIAEVLLEAVRSSDTGYRHAGELPEALAEFARLRWNWAIEPGQVMVMPDVVTSISWTIQALTEPGDGVVISSPVYPPFFSCVRDITRRTLVDVPLVLDPAGRFRLDLDGLARAFARPDVTAILLCSPQNPTGSVPTADELAEVGRLAREHGVAVISDEIHAPLTLPGAVHQPFLSVAPQELRAVALVSASKAWNLAGLKCAQVVAGSDDVMAVLTQRIPIEVTYGAGHLGVLASIAAYRSGLPWLDDCLVGLDARANELAGLLRDRLPKVGYRIPQASYLAWLDCRALGLGDDPADYFLERARVALSAGTPFGDAGKGFVRLNFGTTPGILAEIVDRLGQSLPTR
jgi:cystathionine beta-lyase